MTASTSPASTSPTPAAADRVASIASTEGGRASAKEDGSGGVYLWVTLAVTVCLIVGSLLQWAPDQPSEWRWLPFGIAYLAGGGPIVRDTWLTLQEGRLSIDFLMGVAALGAAGVGQPFEGVVLIFLFSLSNTLEAYAMDRTRRAIGSLMDLHPEEVTLEAEGGGVGDRVPVESLVAGLRILIRPGERIGADGRVVAGGSEVDQSAMTGESVPVRKEFGDEVYAGTINQSGVLTVEVMRPASDFMLSRIIRLVEEAREARAPTQEFIDRFAHPYTILVLVATSGTALAGGLFFGVAWGDAVYRAMTLLVVASPCALVISTPSALLSGIANGARNGVLFKGGAYLDLAGTIDTVAFDKTGTLTEGRPRVLAVRPVSGADTSETELIRLAASVESSSEHHLARAIAAAAVEASVRPAPVTEFRAVAGEGVIARMDGRDVWLGNRVMVDRQGSHLPDELIPWIRDQSEDGRSVIVLGAGDEVLGAMSFGDKIRAGAAPTIRALRSMGVRRVLILSGDHKDAAAAVGREVGADEVLAGLLPDEKVEMLRRLSEASRGTAMVGDGVNDAPAMASATMGVAMGAAGTDVAIETADVILVSDDLEKVAYALRLGRRGRRVVRQNVWFSVGWMAFLVVTTWSIGIPLTLAVIAHEGSTLLVVLNGLRLLR